jgi:hypothetical protein
MAQQLRQASQQLSQHLKHVSVLDFDGCCFCEGSGLMGLCQAADFADHVASGALTADFAAEVESLRTQHADAVREKSAAESKIHRLSEKVATMVAEKAELRRQLGEERREANKAIADMQAAQDEAKVARAEGSVARQLAEELEATLNALRNRVDRAEASMRAEVERTHAQFVDAYRELGAWTADFEAPGQDAGLCFLEWMQEELGVLPTIVTGLMSFASLVTCEGAVNALSREGCRHFEVFDQNDKNFEREIFKVEDPMLKQSVGALFDRMWGPHGRETVRERSDRAIEQVKASFCVVISGGMCGFA